MTESIAERFIRYAKLHTASDPASNSVPSTPGQTEFAGLLAAELTQIGLDDVIIDSNGYITATLPSNCSHNTRTIGLIAHLDTSPDFKGRNVKPVIHEKYDGNPIHLKNSITIHPVEFPELKTYRGQDLITSDGKTLLGADDKAGIAEIVTAVDFLKKNPVMPHGKIRICFTPDEEIGRGTNHFNIKGMGSDFAFTVDGGEIGALEFENFNAALVTVHITGRSVHPGSAKNKMINASIVGQLFVSMLPADERPEHTENYEGFYHLTKFAGNVEKAELQYLIRDHDLDRFEIKKKVVREITGLLNLKFGEGTVRTEIRDQYFNMRQKIEPVMHVVRLAEKAMLAAGVSPKIKPIRGGTDGAKLSYEGLPCPNIFTGGHNFHGPYEFIPIPSMVKAVEVIINICRFASTMKSENDIPVY